MKDRKVYHILRQMADFTIPRKHRRKVREWLAGKNEAEEKEQALLRIWYETSMEPELNTDEALEKTWCKIEDSEYKASRRIFINRLLRYAAVLLLPVISGITVWIISTEKHEIPEMLECYVPNGEQKTMVLPDGSYVHLNSGSLLIYPSEFTKTKRQVYLSGEANFTVESDEKKPFIVKAGILNVEVLGTKFNIESYPGSGFITTTLENGSVRIYKGTNPSAAVTIVPDEQLVYISHENRFIRKTVNANDYTAWTTGELRFMNKTLEEILFTLERKYDVRFLVDTEIKDSDLFTMKFKAHETVEDALYVLGEIMGTITYKRDGQTIRLNLKGKEVRR